MASFFVCRLCLGRTGQSASLRARRSSCQPVSLRYSCATSLKVGLSPRYRPFSLALARRHASRIFATSSHFPDFRFLAGFPSSASAIWRKICGRTSGFRSHSLSPMPQGMSRLSVMRTGSLNCENVKPFSRPHVRSRLVRTEGHRLIRFGLIRFQKPEGSSRIVPEQPLVLDLPHIQRPDDRSAVDVRRVINPF